MYIIFIMFLNGSHLLLTCECVDAAHIYMQDREGNQKGPIPSSEQEAPKTPNPKVTFILFTFFHRPASADPSHHHHHHHLPIFYLIFKVIFIYSTTDSQKTCSEQGSNQEKQAQEKGEHFNFICMWVHTFLELRRCSFGRRLRPSHGYEQHQLRS